MLLLLPDGVTSASWHGVEFKVDERGVIDTPDDAFEDLQWHGALKFEEVEEKKTLSLKKKSD